MNEPKTNHMRQPRRCVECGTQHTDYLWSKHWCPACDRKRIVHLSGQFEALAQRFKGEATDGKANA